MRPRLPPLRRAMTAVFAAGLLFAAPSTRAEAQIFIGAGYGVPFYPFYGPPIVYAPPIIYSSPPVVYAPPPGYAAAPSGRCFAAAYVCPVGRPKPVGAPCSCPTNTGRASGRIG